MSNQIQVTTIRPTSGLFVSFKPRSKEGQPEKQEVFASFSLPALFDAIQQQEVKGFLIRAFSNAVLDCLKGAVKDGKESFSIPALSDLYAETKREFLITRKDLESWLDGFCMPLVSAAIAAKASLHIDSPKVVKKAIAYKETLLQLASRSMMQQDEIDSAIRVLELVANSGKDHAYTDNVAQAIERKQAKLNDYLAGKQDDEEEIDF